MKKNGLKPCYNKGFPLIYLTLLFIGLLTPFISQAYTWNPQEKMNIRIEKSTLEEALKKVRAESGYYILFNVDDVQHVNEVSVNLTNASVAQVLDECLRGTRLTYSIEDRTILIKPASAPARQNVPPIEVTGIVKDENGNPLPGVSVVIKGTNTGAATDANGAFTLQIRQPVGAVLSFSFLGTIPHEEVVSAGRTTYNVTLRSEHFAVEEVVVTGYGNRSTRSYTGSAVTVTQDQLMSAGTKNVLHSLAAYVPGMQMLQNNYLGSDPNNLPEVLLRGRSSFSTGSSLPTFIVDGAEVDLEYIFDMDMTDIENVTVLKDASATALYGSKAANGVIVITTRPITQGGLKVSYRGTYKLVFPDLADYNMLNAAEKLEYERLAGLYTSPYLGEGESYDRHQYLLDERYNTNLQRVLSGVDTDWMSMPLRNAFANTHSVTIYGGDEKVRYNLLGRYGNDAGVMKNSSRQRYELGFKLAYNLNTKLFFQNNFSVNSVNSSDFPFGSFKNYVNQNPYESPYNDDGSFNTNMMYSKKNPVYEESLGTYSKGENFYITNNLDIRYQILSDLRIEGSFKFSKYKNDTEKFISPLSQEFDSKPEDEKGSITVTNTNRTDYQGKLLATWNKSLPHNSLLSIVGGGNIQSNSLNSNGYKGIGLVSDKLAHPAFAAQYPAGESPTGSNDIDRLLGGFINANFIFNNRYFVDGSFRYEGSSKFGSNERYAPFWSLGAGWNLHEMGWFEAGPSDRIKLRGSMGYVGNASFSPYQAMTMYHYNSALNYGKGIGAVPMTIGNPDLKWERALSLNAGLDVNLFDNRLDMTFDYYFKRTDNLLLDVTKAPSVGVLKARENMGQIDNRGIEFKARGNVIRTQDWDWSVSLTATRNWNKIIKISEALKRENAEQNEGDSTAPRPLYQEGESISAIKVVPSAGIDPASGQEIFITREGKMTFIYDFRDKVVYGDSDPKLYGVLSTYVGWKGFSLNLMFDYRLSAMIYNETLVTRVEGSNPYNNADKRVFNDRWKAVGDHARYRDIANQETPRESSRFVQKETSFSLRTISLSYEFRVQQLQKLGMSRLRLELLSNDVFHSSTVKQERGLDYPFARSFELSVSATF